MDSDDEMLALLLEDEQAFNDDLREHLLIIASLQDMLDAEAEKMKRRAAEDQGRGERSRSPDRGWRAYHAAQRLLRR
ncbi:hypothetical protein QYE76_068564 [Lolium multiflorum]|uniref:Uncharacterized protein n=1 Tax=Lolium multiflorum TaxID=4521 RepID=A0AAD8SF22_LOLMU|nr:hypothetical protein QYE76_068564 [Lolium multiflorum]